MNSIKSSQVESSAQMSYKITNARDESITFLIDNQKHENIATYANFAKSVQAEKEKSQYEKKNEKEGCQPQVILLQQQLLNTEKNKVRFYRSFMHFIKNYNLVLECIQASVSHFVQQNSSSFENNL